MKFKLPLKREDIEQLSYEELTALQKALFERATGREGVSGESAANLASELHALLPKIERDPFDDITTSLAQIGDMLHVLERDMQNPDLAFADRINLENAHLVLIRQRERLRQDWQRLLSQRHPGGS